MNPNAERTRTPIDKRLRKLELANGDLIVYLGGILKR